MCGIFFDISKAFDKVRHDGLIYKLIKLEIPVYLIRFIRNFLSDRIFKVKRKNQENYLKYLENLVEWLFKWRLKMNPSKCCYTIFSKNGRGSVVYDLIINGGKFPYNPYPVFLGITFDEKLNFSSHYTNMRVRALKRLNILKIFSHKSWRLNHSTLIVLYRALIGSIFDYSYFTVANVSKSTLDLVQKVQNRSIRLICKVDWICPTNQLFFS